MPCRSESINADSLNFLQLGRRSGGRPQRAVHPHAVTCQHCVSRSQCRLTGHCTVMPLSTCGSLHQSPTSHPDKDFGLPPRTICAFLPSDCLLLGVVLSLSLALVFGTLFHADVTSAPSLFTFRKRLKLHLFPLSYPGLVL